MTSSEIRQSFLDFFREKQHTIVPSSSLLPDSPNLLFTNAGMNQFVPIFLGERGADVSKWGGAIPGRDTRAADTQKCIRAGGKHNDLDDVGLDAYHHTFFEMLGNWSFGDYFKQEAIAWAWELVVERWKFPPERLYATIYQPDAGDPAERDQEAWDIWAEKFRSAGLDPEVHIVNGNKKDNFWMMGETGPCGPCSELHVDLTTAGDTKGSLVNAGDARCIEIWNLVFIQFNANADGSFSPLPAQHVDTGMGFERVTSIIQGTKGLTDFATAKISNYETDIFRPIFDEIERLSGKKYASTLPKAGSTGETEQEKIDVSFRVIADHIRTLSFAIADGIQPGNSDRKYVLRRILRRAVRYGRTLGFTEPFFYKLVHVLAREMGGVFPELRDRQKQVEEVLQREEESFNRTLDKGIELFEREVAKLNSSGSAGFQPAATDILSVAPGARFSRRRLPHYERPHGIYHLTFSTRERRVLSPPARDIVLNAFRHFDQDRYDLFAVCVMPDHVHALLQPSPKSFDAENQPVFWSLSELTHSIKSFTANQINQAEQTAGRPVWEIETFDRLMRSDAETAEKFTYICENPWRDEMVGGGEDYRWVWSWEERGPRQDAGAGTLEVCAPGDKIVSAEFAFRLYDEQGFPLDLTELMARERGLKVDIAGFEKLMEEQRNRARAAQKKTVIELSEIATKDATNFLGYDHDHTGADVQEVLSVKGKTVLIANNSVCYAEMGGQVGDTGVLIRGADTWRISNTRKSGDTWLHFLEESDAPEVGEHITIELNRARRSAIQRHHTVTHLLHWALHEVVSPEAAQKGSFVGPDKLTFDFNHQALTPAQVREVEDLVNAKIVENAVVSWTEVPYADVRGREDIMQFFGDKYGETVRVVQIGGGASELNGYSMELCAGTHARATGELGLFKIASEGAIAAGVRRIEAVAGTAALQHLHQRLADQEARVAELEARLLETGKALEKERSAQLQRQADEMAARLIPQAAGDPPRVIEPLGEVTGDQMQKLLDAFKARQFEGVAVFASTEGEKVHVAAYVSADLTRKFQAGKIVQEIAPIVGGKGGGRPEFARGAGRDAAKIGDALTRARELLS